MISEYLTRRLYASFYVYLKTDKRWWTIVSIFTFMIVMDQGLQEQPVINGNRWGKIYSEKYPMEMSTKWKKTIYLGNIKLQSYLVGVYS